MKSMKTEIFHTIRLLVLGLVVAIGLSYAAAFASEWVPAPATPPAENTQRPINTLGASQVKDGGLSVYAFLANLSAQFDSQLYLQGTVRGFGGKFGGETVRFGGTNASGVHIVSLALTGNLDVKNNARSALLANTEYKKVCADESGTLFLCDTTTQPVIDVCPNISGDQATVPAGMHINLDGDCVDDIILPPPNNGDPTSCTYYVTAEPYQFRHPKIKFWRGYATPTGSSGANPQYTGTLYSGPFYQMSFKDFDMQGCVTATQMYDPDGVPIGVPVQQACDPSPSQPGSPYSWSWSPANVTINLMQNPGVFEVGVFGLEGLRFTGPVTIKTAATGGSTITVPPECTSGFYQ